MKRFLIATFAAGLLAAGSGCAVVTSSQAGYTNVTGEGWYTEAIGFFGITWGSKVWYCPPPAQGPGTCKEAKLVELTKAEQDAQKEAEKAAK